jgi:phage regulator Rha-like protein
MTSLEIADLVDSRHDKVKQSIERLAERGAISHPPMGDGPKSTNGVVTKVYLIGKRDSYVIVAQLSPEFTARLVDRWQELEAGEAPAPALPKNYIAALEDLLASKKAEALAIEQRDAAIKTKALIGSKREASAMATASAAKREANRLRDALGFNARHATVKAVEKATKAKYEWRPLRKYCDEHGLPATYVTDPLYGEVRAWPAGAWADVHGVDIAELFGEAA